MSETLTPEQFVEEIAVALPESSDTEAHRLIEHARAWAIVYYSGDVPAALEARIDALEEGNAHTRGR